MSVHASHAALPYPIKKARFTLAVPYLDADGDPTDPTTPDTEFSLDGGAAADCAEETATYRNSVALFTLTGAETDGSVLSVAFKAASGPKTTLVTLYPRALALVGSGTLSVGSAGGGTLGTLLPYDVTGCFIRTTGGTGGGGTGGANNQARKIATYNTTTGAFTVVPDWETTPSTDTTYDVLLPEGVTLGMLRQLSPGSMGVHFGTAQAGAAGSVTLATSAVATTNYYRGGYAYVVGGTGAGQGPRYIYAYNTSRVASVSPNWAVTPDTTSQIVVIPAPLAPTQAGELPSMSLAEILGVAVQAPGTGGVLPVDIVRVANTAITGDGSGTPWGPA